MYYKGPHDGITAIRGKEAKILLEAIDSGTFVPNAKAEATARLIVESMFKIKRIEVQKDVDPDITDLVNKHFWDLV